MNTQQPKALYLASELRAGKWMPNILRNESGLRDRAADELERLHNENEALCAAIAAVAQMVASKDTGLPATPLYVEPRPVAQAQDTREPLTNEQIERLAEENGSDIDGFARAIKAAHGIK